MTEKGVKREKEAKRRLLGEMLLEAGLIDEVQLAVALGQHAKTGVKLGTELLRLGFVAEHELAMILERQMGIKWVSLDGASIPLRALKAVPLEIAMKYQVMPVDYDGKTLTLATTRPRDMDMLQSLVYLLERQISPVLALESEINKAIVEYYGTALGAAKDPGVKQASGGEGRARISMLDPGVQEAVLGLLLKKKVISKEELLEELRGKGK
jgi:hypothetical protein